jgi:ankyrin repeat protein
VLTKANCNSVDAEGDPLLMNAALYASVEMMELLLQKGANPNAKNRDGETALMWAMQDIEKVKILLKHRADVNLSSASGNTALLVGCVGADKYAVVKLLAGNGADLLQKNARKETALMRAALFGDTATLSLLATAGNEIDGMDSTGLTPLLNAIFNVNRPATIWLLNHGADADKVAAYGLTAITAVVTYNDVPLVTAVLQKTKNINTVDAFGISALMWAAYNEHDNPSILQALLDKGADVTIKAKNGDTALSWAMKKGNTKTVALLKKAGAH